MTRYLKVPEAEQLHQRLIEQTGGSDGLRDRGVLESAVAQPKMSFGGEDLYRGLHEKAAALAYALVQNHPFVDGNKRVGHAAMEVFLLLNGHEIEASVDEQEQLFLGLAAGEIGRTELATWLSSHLIALGP